MSRGSEGPVELLTKAGEVWYRYRTQNRATPPQPQRGHQAKWAGDGRGFTTDLATEAWKLWNLNSSGAELLPVSILLRLEASKLVQHNPAPDPTVMSPEAIGLHSALASMSLNDPD